MLTGCFPSRSERSLLNWKNKRGGEEKACGAAAEISVSETRPPAATCAIGRLTFHAKPLRSIDRALPGEAQR